jgi:hypothetical protein
MRPARIAGLAAVAATLAYAAAVAAPAMAYPAPGGIYAPFTDCPLDNPAYQNATPGDGSGCLASISRSGSLSIAGVTVPITHQVTTQFGWYSFDSSGTQVFLPVTPDDGKTVVASPEQVPGGLLGIMAPGSLLNAALKSGPTAVTAQVQPAGLISFFSLDGALGGAPVFGLPVKIKLNNALLGGSCYIGSNADPILFNPQWGPTSPPPPNQSISGVFGAFSLRFDPNPSAFPQVVVFVQAGATFVDNSFRVPQATGCGPQGQFDGAINVKERLVSVAGKNTLILSNTTAYLGDDYSQSQASDLLSAFAASTP